MIVVFLLPQYLLLHGNDGGARSPLLSFFPLVCYLLLFVFVLDIFISYFCSFVLTSDFLDPVQWRESTARCVETEETRKPGKDQSTSSSRGEDERPALVENNTRAKLLASCKLNISPSNCKLRFQTISAGAKQS
ncbi:hypothetical protein BDBG_17663 [Blastomyces gilchristii SLH14081]|uniref:Uncharacterized protein n=1 Tax=Blastomyces gilchristii (strain SLH14081) TaxID=559298 RepID=A0A179UYR4_BLAGS|nr:uncharacterized protein BDBG_17663 [Blastomyces gilchristii SLH14081]OAT12359.1 hypothetical protein BDBG_17663 [Blastomyces gilchristii SLH14081]